MINAQDGRFTVIVIKDGEPKELSNLSKKVLIELEKAYEKTPLVGLSHETYSQLTEFFSNKLGEYEAELMELEQAEATFAKTVAFARAFDISYDESPAMVDMMLRIERMLTEQKTFTSKDICMKHLNALTNLEWREANKDFRKWARKLFEDTGLKIGIIRMMKFYYGVISVA